jgi:hypothetical protein
MSPSQSPIDELIPEVEPGPRGNDLNRYWGAIWLAPILETKLQDEEYRFEVKIRDDPSPTVIRSKSFRADLSVDHESIPIEPESGMPENCVQSANSARR